MGIDKSNVSFVVHYNMPKNLESYYQEAGRAGRDGEKAQCVLLFSPGDVQTARFLILNAEENEALSEEDRLLVREKDLQRLDQMTAYCKTTRCLRGFLLSYFGEEAPERCGNCGSCNAELIERDITVEAQKILSGVARIEKKYPYGLGISMVMKMLRGSREQRIFDLGLDRLSTYGIMQETDHALLRDYIDFLTEKQYLTVSIGEYPVLKLGKYAGNVLFHGEKVSYLSRKNQSARAAGPVHPGKKAEISDDGLFEDLKALRFRLASEAHVPAYIVFANAALADMAAKRPVTMGEFLQVSGVGEVKAARYGEVFLEEIRRWIAEHPEK